MGERFPVFALVVCSPHVVFIFSVLSSRANAPFRPSPCAGCCPSTMCDWHNKHHSQILVGLLSLLPRLRADGALASPARATRWPTLPMSRPSGVGGLMLRGIAPCCRITGDAALPPTFCPAGEVQGCPRSLPACWRRVSVTTLFQRDDASRQVSRTARHSCTAVFF